MTSESEAGTLAPMNHVVASVAPSGDSSLRSMGARDGMYHDVDGAPFKIGDVVKVVSFSDDTAAEEFLGCQGAVLYFEYFCGCGQTFPNDPMIGVQFGERTAEFWKEELARASDGDR